MKKVLFDIKSIALDDHLRVEYKLVIPGVFELENESFIAYKSDFENFLDSKLRLDVLEWNESMTEPVLMNDIRRFMFEKLNLGFVNRSLLQDELIEELKNNFSALILKQDASTILNDLKPMQRATGKPKENSQKQSKKAI